MYRYLKLLLMMVTITAFALPVFADSGMVRLKSEFDAPTTAERLVSLLNKKGMKVFIRVDHAAGAKSAGLELRPTELVVFGNPKVGTPLMQCSQSVALDLPQKALIWKDQNGEVWLGYNTPRYIADRHAVQGCEQTIKKIEKALANFARGATSKRND